MFEKWWGSFYFWNTFGRHECRKSYLFFWQTVCQDLFHVVLNVSCLVLRGLRTFLGWETLAYDLAVGSMRIVDYSRLVVLERTEHRHLRKSCTVSSVLDHLANSIFNLVHHEFLDWLGILCLKHLHFWQCGHLYILTKFISGLFAAAGEWTHRPASSEPIFVGLSMQRFLG